jgi:hypothetical protein
MQECTTGKLHGALLKLCSLESVVKGRLEQVGFKVFLDQTEYVAGLDLQRETKRQVAKSRQIVILDWLG